MSEEFKKPWENNPSWSSGNIASAPEGAGAIWFFAILWNAISSPAVFMGIPEMYRAEKYWQILVISLFPAIGLLIIYFAIYKTLQNIKYSKSSFKMAKVPGVIGGSMVGELLLPVKLAGAEEINVRLVNINQVTTGSGKNRSTRRNTIWQTSRAFKQGEWKVQNGHVIIPLDLTISYETRDHDKTNMRNCVYWNLEVYSAMPGIDFSTVFEVPVFKTEESDPEIITSSKDEERILDKQPNMKGITYQELADGIRIFVHPFKFIGGGIGFLTFAIAFGIGSAVLINKGLTFFACITMLFTLLFLACGIHFILIQTEIVFYQNFGQIKSTWLGLGFIREFDLRDIKDIKIKVTSQTTSDVSQDKCNFTLEFIPHEGSRLSLSEMTSCYDQILWIKAKLKQKLPETESHS
ncbi:MAG: hypothetical protein NE327_02325 [Lentisphaeraceae bacterium]|nr:hypothetical protein [Lentisphaeraceae bacterium]